MTAVRQSGYPVLARSPQSALRRPVPQFRQLITQHKLEAYRQVKQQADAAEKKRVELQRELIALLDANAEVQLGPLAVQLIEWQAKNFSFDKVAAVLGHQYATEIKSQIEPTLIRFVQVADRADDLHQRPENMSEDY